MKIKYMKNLIQFQNFISIFRADLPFISFVGSPHAQIWLISVWIKENKEEKRQYKGTFHLTIKIDLFILHWRHTHENQALGLKNKIENIKNDLHT